MIRVGLPALKYCRTLGVAVSIVVFMAGNAWSDCPAVQRALLEVNSDTPDFGSFSRNATVECGSVQEVRGRARYCAFQHPFRSSDAEAQFQELATSLTACLDLMVVQTDDKRVNHPDSYRVRKFVSDREAITLSIKDKSQIDSTFVFLRRGPLDSGS